MKIVQRFLTDVLLLEPKIYSDARGHFFESYNELECVLLGIAGRFVQDNESRSAKNVLRGLHYQLQHPQGKLVRVLQGEVFDVAVDLRRGSKTFGQWSGVTLSSASHQMLWIPPGFAHGFLALSDHADILYKATNHYSPTHERTVRWDDPELKIGWPTQGTPILSARDAAAAPFRLAEVYESMVPPTGPGFGMNAQL